MAIGWLTVLQNVPWTDLLRNAPQIADGAKKLWKSVARQTGIDPNAVPSATPVARGATDSDPAALAMQVQTLERRVADLHQQMLESSALIQSLADQNAQLIARIDTDRRRARRWLAVVAVLAPLLGASLALWLGARVH